jgi:hypothetical protein
MVVLGTTIHEFALAFSHLPVETRGWSAQVQGCSVRGNGIRFFSVITGLPRSGETGNTNTEVALLPANLDGRLFARP